jgi:hypothetical protein
VRRASPTQPTRVERAFYKLAFRAETDPRARAIVVKFVNAVFRAIAVEKKRGGRRLFDFARKAAVRFGRWRAPVLRAQLDLDVTSVADMGRLQDWEDRVFDVTGHWTEKTRARDQVRDGVPVRRGREGCARDLLGHHPRARDRDVPGAEPAVPARAPREVALEGRLALRVRARDRGEGELGLQVHTMTLT